MANLVASLREQGPHGSVVECSYNGPCTHSYAGGHITLASDLGISVGYIIDALLRLFRSGDAAKHLTWVALGTNDADFDPSVVDTNDGLEIERSYRFQRVRSEPAQYRAFKTFCNDVLSPVLHMTPEIRRRHFRFLTTEGFETWRGYAEINHRLATSACMFLSGCSDHLHVHDFEAALVPALVRQERSDIRITYFGHVSWPCAEELRSLRDKSIRAAILNGILGADRAVFHTDICVRHFMDCVAEEFGDQVCVDETGLCLNSRRIEVMSQPIGVNIEALLADVRRNDISVDEDRILGEVTVLKERFKLCLSAERSDFTKGVIERLHVIESLLDRRPDIARTVRFIQIIVPSRQYLSAYKTYLADVQALTARINERHAMPGYPPVIWTYGPISRRALLKLFSGADMMWCHSLNDGLCLVPKEYVAVGPEDGALVLSKGAGASVELCSAFEINPFDQEGAVKTIDLALASPREDREL